MSEETYKIAEKRYEQGKQEERERILKEFEKFWKQFEEDYDAFEGKINFELLDSDVEFCKTKTKEIIKNTGKKEK